MLRPGQQRIAGDHRRHDVLVFVAGGPFVIISHRAETGAPPPICRARPTSARRVRPRTVRNRRLRRTCRTELVDLSGGFSMRSRRVAQLFQFAHFEQFDMRPEHARHPRQGRCTRRASRSSNGRAPPSGSDAVAAATPRRFDPRSDLLPDRTPRPGIRSRCRISVPAG